MELGDLDATLSTLAEHGVATVLVGGDAGVGKSRLIEEFCTRARDAGALVAVGLCTPAEGGGLPYGPVVGVLRELGRQLGPHDVAELLEPVQQGLGLGRSSWADRLEHSAMTLSPALGVVKTSLFETMLSSLGVLATRSPLVLVFEDLQWADSASLELLDFLTRNLVESRVLLIGTYRTEEVGPDRALRRVFAELGRHARVSHIELTGLDRAEIAQLLSGALGETPDWVLVDAVYSRSGGNPFFAEELAATRHVTTLPPALRNVLMIRLERLSPSARHVVAIAAAAGASIDDRLLAAAAELDPAARDAAVAETVEHGVLVADPGATTFRFRHALLGEAAYGAMLPGERTRLHHRIADALTAQPDLRATGPGHADAELAAHWWEAGEWPAAFQASVSVAVAAAELLAMPEAAAHFERALSAYQHSPTECRHATIDHAELLMRAADAVFLSNDGPRSMELAQQALAHLNPETDASRVVSCYTMLARNAWAGGDVELVFDSFERAKALMPATSASVPLAGVLAEEARILMLTSHFDDSIALCREALTVARDAGSRADEGHVLNTLGTSIALRGDVDGGLALVRESLEIAEELAHPDQINRAYANLAAVLLQAGRLEETAAVVLDAVARGGSLLELRLNGAAQQSADALTRLGRWDEAEALLSRVANRGAGSCQYLFYLSNAVMHVRRGRFAEADQLLAIADDLTAGRNALQERGWLYMLQAELHLEQGDARAASDDIERALTIAAGTDAEDERVEMYTLGLRALADEFVAGRARGRRVDADKARRTARNFVEEAERFAAGYVERGWEQTARLEALVAMCRAEETRLDPVDSELWLEAVRSWDEAGEPYPAAYCRWRAAEAILAVRGERRAAIEAAQAAWRTCQALGARPLQVQVERLAERARIPLAAAAEPPAPSHAQSVAADLGLTAREVEVLAQLARGRTDRQIADELFISKKTASVHVSNLLRKLDVSSRLDAAEIGQRADLA
jgi:DNA-binding CsgD family transcriptional regulator/tetratricopeptide (TPR) repeat protein